MAKPNENWQERIYEAFTQNVKLDVNNPQEGLNGPIVYNWMSSSKSGEQASVGQLEGGIYHIYNDQCIEIVGGKKADGGVCVNIIGSDGDICITALSGGDVKITGTNIMLDAQKDLAINCGSNFSVKANKINMKSNECYISAPRGKITVRDVSWSGTVFKGTTIDPSKFSGEIKNIADNLDKSQIQDAAKQAASQLQDVAGDLQNQLGGLF